MYGTFKERERGRAINAFPIHRGETVLIASSTNRDIHSVFHIQQWPRYWKSRRNPRQFHNVWTTLCVPGPGETTEARDRDLVCEVRGAKREPRRQFSSAIERFIMGSSAFRNETITSDPPDSYLVGPRKSPRGEESDDMIRGKRRSRSRLPGIRAATRQIRSMAWHPRSTLHSGSPPQASAHETGPLRFLEATF